MPPITLDGTRGITTPTYNGSTTAEYLVPVTGFKNRIINGDMTISQRNGTSSVTPTDGQYTLDRWKTTISQTSKFTIQQDAGAVTPPVGFGDYLGVTSSSAYSITSSDYFFLEQVIEGFNTADLAWGTVNAATVTLSFWVRSSLTGTFGGAIRNNANDRAYPFTYTISAANTWEQKSITITGDTTGTWVGATNGAGLKLDIGLGAGSTFSGTAGSWSGNNFVSATGAVSVVGTNGATFYITGVQLEKGSNATSFDYLPYGTELALCQRYYYQVTAGGSAFTQFGAGRAFSGTAGNGIVPFPVPMRTAPTFAFLGVVGNYDFGPTAISSGAVPASNTHMTVGMTFSSITSGSMFWLGQSASATPCGFTFSAEL